MEAYIGHKSQVSRIEEVRLVGGKGDNMRLLQIDNGTGLQITLILDRCADISRLTCDGVNIGYFAPCGYVGSQYVTVKRNEFLKSFTAGFLTTCGIDNVGPYDDELSLGLHGSLSSLPCVRYLWDENEDELIITCFIEDGCLFGRKMDFTRTFTVSKRRKVFRIEDKVHNLGDEKMPCMILYHCNLGYPFLDESSELTINSSWAEARDKCSEKEYRERLDIKKPTKKYKEKCFFYQFNEKKKVSILNRNKNIRFSIDFQELKYLTQWNMFGQRDYVLGLEPGNVLPIGYKKNKEQGNIEMIEPNEHKIYSLEFSFTKG